MKKTFFDELENGDPVAVRKWLDAGYSPNARTEEGYTPLFLAIEFFREEVVDVLLESGADPNLPVDETGCVPIRRVVMGAPPRIAASLLRHGARIDLRFEDKKTLLDYCYENAGPEIAALLLEAGLDWHDAASHDDPDFVRWITLVVPAVEAVVNNDVQTLESLIRGRLGMKIFRSGSLFALAMRHNKPDIVRLLLTFGVDFQEANDAGVTPLMQCAMFGYPQIARLFIDAGASLSAKTHRSGENALDIAVERGHLDIAEMLRDALAKQ